MGKNSKRKRPVVLVLSYVLLVSAAIAATLAVARPNAFNFSGSFSATSSDTIRSGGDGFELWDAESLCETVVKARAPARSVVSVDSRSSRQVSTGYFQVVVQVDAPGHYSGNRSSMVCRADMITGQVAARPLGDEKEARQKSTFGGFSLQNLF